MVPLANPGLGSSKGFGGHVQASMHGCFVMLSRLFDIAPIDVAEPGAFSAQIPLEPSSFCCFNWGTCCLGIRGALSVVSL